MWVYLTDTKTENRWSVWAVVSILWLSHLSLLERRTKVGPRKEITLNHVFRFTVQHENRKPNMTWILNQQKPESTTSLDQTKVTEANNQLTSLNHQSAFKLNSLNIFSASDDSANTTAAGLNTCAHVPKNWSNQKLFFMARTFRHVWVHTDTKSSHIWQFNPPYSL